MTVTLGILALLEAKPWSASTACSSRVGHSADAVAAADRSRCQRRPTVPAVHRFRARPAAGSSSACTPATPSAWSGTCACMPSPVS